ncbi:MAG: hypothetical protein ACFFCO_02995 [Promethearchaeota archaeon]
MLSENEVALFYSMLKTKDSEIYIGATRYLLFEISLLSYLQQEIEAVVGADGAFALFYNASKEAGKVSVERDSFSKLFAGMSFTDQIGFIMKFAQFHGWGVFEIAEFSKEPFRCVFKYKHSYVLDKYGGKADGPRCYYVSCLIDIIEMFAKMNKFDLKLQTTETKCVATGDSYCEWVIEPETLE